MKTDLHIFTIPKNAIRSEASIEIAAPPEEAAAIYRDVAKWNETFSETIAYAWVIQMGIHWKEIEVTHKQEECVSNTLIDLSETEIGLIERKQKFDAWFLNRFSPIDNGGTHYTISGFIRLKGIYKLLAPLIKGYTRRRAGQQMRYFVLEPLKAAAERNRGRRSGL